MMVHMLKNIIKLPIISQLLISMLLLTSTKLKFQSVLNKMISNWDKIYKHNSQETTLMMHNTLKPPRTQSTTHHTIITVLCNKRVKNNIKLIMILKFWLIFKDLKEPIDCISMFYCFKSEKLNFIT